VLGAQLEPGPPWNLGHLIFFLFGCSADSIPSPDPEPDPDPLASPPDETMTDGNGSVLADLGSVDIDHAVIRVPYASSFSDPVVIVGPPTAHESDPGVAQVLDVDGDGFRVRFSEWTYLDDLHASETVSYLVVTPGRHVLPDGSVWEAGVLDVSDTGVWASQFFSAPFDSVPQLFLTVQTSNEDEPLVVRARELSSDGFQAALFEEEAADGLRGVEQVGYLAVHSPVGSGRMDSASGSLPYLTSRVVADDRRVPVLSASIWLEEEASLDAELVHADEDVSFMAIGPHVFAQDLSGVDLDTVAVRRAAPEYGPVLEWGTVANVGAAWQTVPLAREYTDPVVVVGPMSSADPSPALPRVRNVATDAFEIRSISWPYIGRDHGVERVFYLVTDPGIQSLDGLVVEAGHLDTTAVLRQAEETVTLPMPYADIPGVFASVMSANGVDPVTVRVLRRTAAGFNLAMQPEEAYTGGVPAERLGWVSIEHGRVVTSDGRVVNVFEANVSSTAVAVPFGETMAGRFPTALGTISSALGFDPVILRYDDLTPDDIVLQLEEEQSANPETNHPAEEISLLVAD
jgi:hypothetical protein